MLVQSDKAKHDVAAIRPFVSGYMATGGSYGRNTYIAQLCSIPYDDAYGDWTPERVGRALVNYCSGGWSPFGGFATCTNVAELEFEVNVFND